MAKKKTACFLLFILCAALMSAPPAPAGTTYAAAVNINGSDNSGAQSSGTLPGASPTTIAPVFRTKDGRIIPMWYDRVFPPLDPTLLEETKKILEDKKKIQQTIRQKTYSTGDSRQFWVKDDNDAAWRQVTATVKKTATHSYLFVDTALSIPDASLQLYVTEFETMYTVLASNLGTFVDRDDNGKVVILLYDVNDSGSINGYLGGYFWSKDYYADSLTRQQGIRSNEMDVIYIRGDKPAGWDQVGKDFYEYNLTTLVHEYQHLVQFGELVWNGGRNSADVWIDEMMSMAVETMYFKEKLRTNPSFTHPDMLSGGYLSGRIEYYNQDYSNSIRNGHGLTYWNNNGDVYANYTLSYLFGQYLSLHATSGQAIFKTILDYMIANGVTDYRAVAAAAASSIPGIATWEDILRNWAIANLVNNSSGLAGYKGAFTLTAHGPTTNPAYIYNSGVVYRQLYGSWTTPSDAGADIRFYVFDDSGNFTGTTTSTIPASTTPSTAVPSSTTTTTIASGSTTSTVPHGTSTTTTTDVACPDPAFPHDCFEVNGSCCAAGYPVCCPTGCCPENFPYCGSDGFCHDTPQELPGLCPAELVLAENSEALDLLRSFRDEVLVTNQNGALYIQLYYRHAPELSMIFVRHPELARQAAGCIAEVLPSLRRGGKIVLRSKTVEDMRHLCSELALYGSPALQADLLKLRGELKSHLVLESLGVSVLPEADN